MVEKNHLKQYIYKLFKNWYQIILIPPAVAGLISFYIIKTIVLGITATSLIFIISYFFASYKVWLEEKDKNKKLQEKITALESKKPKLKLTFENKKEEFKLNNKVIRRVLKKQKIAPRTAIAKVNLLTALASSLANIQESYHEKVIDEFSETFVPLSFELHNIGNCKATSVRVKIQFPKDLILISDLPRQEGFYGNLALLTNQTVTQSNYFEKGNILKLWFKISLHPSCSESDKLYVKKLNKGEFKIKYKIYAEELDSNGIKGELVIKGDPVEEIKEYASKEEKENDERRYNEILEEQMEKTLKY